MGIYFFLRYGIVLFAFIGWIVYQLKFKRKPWIEIQGDVIAIVFFLLIASGIYYWIMA